MLTAGLDLAAEPKGTAIAEVHWSGRAARLVSLRTGVTDDEVLAVAQRVDKLAIDCAFGWPDEFVAFVTSRADLESTTALAAAPAPGETGIAWRRRLAYRETDRDIRERTGRWPLSVSTDRLGLTAMRCAIILDALATSGLDVDRSGSGVAVEVYPAASLRQWGITSRGSKRDEAVLASLVQNLTTAAPWLDLSAGIELMRASHDAFDAVIAALAARSSAIGDAPTAPPMLLEKARREGWIALPGPRLAALVDSGPS